ncbi:MAG TPA: glycosyltransferase [Burkholderiales bacterium]|nr:glycosyltransferase [Burkholderiales bacterium]
MKALLVDPSLFTAPYDAALTGGLLSAGVQPIWTTRAIRPGDRMEIPPDCVDGFFYRRTDQANWAPRSLRPLLKGCGHIAGLATLLWKIYRTKPDVVHVQWIVVPILDLVAMALIRRSCALVLTVHDTLPYNGETMSLPQRLGNTWPARLAHEVIVHTRAARRTLCGQGVPGKRVTVIPHGPLQLSVTTQPPRTRDSRWTAVLFGEIKPYKGLDVLIDAVAALPPSARRQLRVVVAGRPRMDVAPLAARIAALGLAEHFELRLRRQSEEEMSALFAEADGFLFPYRQVDASGVYYLVKALGKWLIASRVGIFAEDMVHDTQGALVPPGDVASLARALQHAVSTWPRPRKPLAPPTTWAEIGEATRALYERACVTFRQA